MNIALDIGHANGTGARGNGLEEHAVATVIVNHLAYLLGRQGHKVDVIDFPKMSNADDLNATINAANTGRYDFGVSVHCDCSGNTQARGAHVCYLSHAGQQLAQFIAEPLAGLLPGRADITVKRTNLAILKQTRPLWVLCECGFVSHLRDSAVMESSPNAIARAIARGVESYTTNLK